MTHLVIGNGEIGKAIAAVFEADTYDIHTGGMEDGQYDVLHICFPYSKKFVDEVKRYNKIYNPDVIIIHSTVPIGTTRKLGVKAAHSPVRGVHPNLEAGVRTFVKYIGAVSEATGELVVQIYKEVGLNASAIYEPEETEAGKLLDTTYYGWNIMFEKYIYEFCKKNNLDVDVVYNHFNQTYNDGYKKLDMENVVRPILKHYEGKIGGHCVIPNCELLDFKPARIILEKNKKL